MDYLWNIQQRAIISYLLIITKMKIAWQTLKLLLTNTEEVKILKHNSKEPVNVIIRYYVIYILNIICKKLIDLRNCIDIKSDKIQITKNYNGHLKTIIIDSKKMDHSVLSIKDIIEYMDKLESLNSRNSCADVSAPITNINSKCVFIRFELFDKEKNSKCLKDYVLKYNDVKSEHHHTLDNILLFNKESPTEEDWIEITLYKNRKIQIYKFPYEEVRNAHINYFYDL